MEASFLPHPLYGIECIVLKLEACHHQAAMLSADLEAKIKGLCAQALKVVVKSCR